MKPTLLYIHGLGSDRNSRKFLNLKDYFKDQFRYDFIEWNNESNILQLLKNKLHEGQTVNQYIIFGDSTGANFAYHFKALRGKSKDILIMSSPLLDIERRIANYEFLIY